jgi:hypothetical protein
MAKTCANDWCQQKFKVLPQDIELLKKFDVEESYFQKCSLCRHMERAIFRPTMNFYHRESDLSGKKLISIYTPQKPYKIYSVEEWWSDKWDELSYGRDFDFTRPFFPQFEALFKVVPKMAVNNTKSENCEYSTNTGHARNCYYSFRTYRSEDILYSETIASYNQDLCDCLKCYKSSWLYNCIQCHGCHLSTDLLECENCRDCFFCTDCVGCQDCLFCSNLRQQKYHVFNKPVSKEEFKKIKETWITGSFSKRQECLEQCNKIYKKAIYPALRQRNCEDCVGDQLINCAHCYECYDSVRGNGCRFAWDLSPSKDANDYLDVTGGGIGDLLFNSSGCGGTNYFFRMCVLCRGSSELTYCINCFSCQNCFGCTGLRNKKYCILNKQYSPDEYQELVKKIIDYLKTTDEWGQFFPQNISPFAFNESSACSYATLTKEQALKYGFSWQEEDGKDFQASTLSHFPDAIDEVNDSFCSEILTCTETGKNYKIIPKELKFYQQMNLSIPRKCPDQRMLERRKMIKPRWLFNRHCDNCKTEIQTSFDPKRSEKVYCEKCYLNEVH